MTINAHYRAQRNCGQGYVFTRVCDSVNRGDLWQGDPPPGKETHPLGRENPPGRETPLCRETPWQGEPPPPQQVDPPGKQTPPSKENPPWQGDPPGIRSMSGRYASYWNAFLFNTKISTNKTSWLHVVKNIKFKYNLQNRGWHSPSHWQF